MGKTYKADPKLTYEKHRWVLDSARPQEWGATVTFRCENSGCTTRVSVPVSIDGKDSGICFDRSAAIVLEGDAE